MKKILIFCAVIVFIYLFAGVWAWLELNYVGGLYYKEGIKYYDQGNWDYALKGDQKLKPGFNKVYKSGGFEDIVLAWQDVPAFLRPGLYGKADKEIDDIINNKLTIAQGESIYKAYLGYDNAFLDAIMLRVGDLYAQQGDKKDALASYEKVKTTFKYTESSVEQADQRIAALGK